MTLFLDMIATILELALPFAFVFSLLFAQKCLMKEDYKFIFLGLLAGLCLLLMLCGVPHPQTVV